MQEYVKLQQSISAPSGIPPKKFLSAGLFDGSPPIKDKDKLKMIERMAVHCIWEKLEKMEFDVYGEQYIGKIQNKRKIIDLIAVKDGRALGIEVKCRKSITTKSNFIQFQDYHSILKKKGIPFLVFWVPLPYQYLQYRRESFFVNIHRVPKYYDDILKLIYPIFLKVYKSPPFYDIDVVLEPWDKRFRQVRMKRVPLDDMEWILRGHPAYGKYEYLPVEELCEEYRSIEFERLIDLYLEKSQEDSSKNINLNPTEANFEHKVWKLLRKRYKVLCQFPIEIPNKPQKRIDLLLTYPKKIACEVKYNVSKSMINQIRDYIYSPTLQDYTIFVAIPKENERKLKKLLTKIKDYNIDYDIGVITLKDEKITQLFPSSTVTLDSYSFL